jgi:hypothetical protein
LFGFTRTSLSRTRWSGRHLWPDQRTLGFGKAKVLPPRSEKFILVKFFDQTFFQKSLRVWAAPTTCNRMRKARGGYFPPLRGGGLSVAI